MRCYDFVSNGVYVVGRVEGGELVRQQVSGAEEDEAAHADEVVGVGVQHHGRHLPLLVAAHEHAPPHAQRRQLVVLLVLTNSSLLILGNWLTFNSYSLTSSDKVE